MAIFSRTQIPKYQSPIRITRPYIKPNYLADTITSAIQGYGSIQNMNLQQQLFNAKLAQQKKQQDRYDATQAGYQQLLQQQIGTPAGPPQMVGGPHMDNTEMMTGYATTPAVPGMNQMESVMAAIQSNPNAQVQDLIAMAGGINKLQNPTSGLNPYQMQNQANWQQRFDRQEQWRKEDLAAKQATASKARIEKASLDAQAIVGKVFGKPLLSDFQHKQDKFWSGDPESGTESTETFLANAEWFDLKGVDAYNAMMKNLEQVATKWLLEGKPPNDVRRDLHEIYRQGTQKHAKGWQPPEIPQLLQAQIEETRAKNKAKRDRLTATSQ
tara:strand:- start:9617 stop:10594 length:978 start_codon:yes stop_codon:yes gene_type:complete